MANLKTEMNSILQKFGAQVDETFMKVEEGVAEDGVKTLKQTSPKRSGRGGGRGRYARGWTYTKTANGFVIHNKTDYQLAHLLEYGHDIVRGGKKVGHSDAIPHIKDVEEWVQDEAVKRLEEAFGQ